MHSSPAGCPERKAMALPMCFSAIRNQRESCLFPGPARWRRCRSTSTAIQRSTIRCSSTATGSVIDFPELRRSHAVILPAPVVPYDLQHVKPVLDRVQVGFFTCINRRDRDLSNAQSLHFRENHHLQIEIERRREFFERNSL